MPKKQTVTEKYIKKAVKETAKKVAGSTVTNCTFNGVKFDEKATEAMVQIAEALEENCIACAENAKALGQLCYVLKASNVDIESMIKIGME